MGCTDSSFGASLFSKDVLTLTLGLKDDLVDLAQVALERGFPTIVSPFGSRRLPFPSGVFDTIHCGGCTINWHANGLLFTQLLIFFFLSLSVSLFFFKSISIIFHLLFQMLSFAGGKHLLEINRILRPGGYFILSTKHDNIEDDEGFSYMFLKYTIRKHHMECFCTACRSVHFYKKLFTGERCLYWKYT